MISIKEIIYTTNILQASPKDALSKALSKLPSSHSAAFIFSSDKRNVGLVNPYHCIIRSSLPGNAKVESCIFHAPRLYLSTPMEKVIQAFISSKIHYLPVFNEKDTFAGVISARKVLDAYKNTVYFNTPINTVLSSRHKPLVTIEEKEPISTAVHMFKTFKISKLIVVNKDNKLKGVLSYYDIINFLISPKRQKELGDRDSKKDNFYKQKVSKFSKNYVLTLSKDDTMHRALEMVLVKRIGSVIIVDTQRHPVGIITTRDFFSLILKTPMQVKFQLFNKHLSQSSNDIVKGFYKSFNNFLNQLPELSKASLTVKEEKNGGLFKVLFSMLPVRGEPEVIKREGKNLKLVLQETKKTVRNLHNKKEN